MCVFMCGSLENFDEIFLISVHKSFTVISRILVLTERVQILRCNLENFNV